MTKSLTYKSRSSQALLTQIISNNQLITEVQSLDAGTLKKIIRRIGLEDSSELLMLLTSEQLQEVMDLDVWASPRAGVDEELDPERFCTWLEMLLEIGSDFAADKVAEMDEDLLASVFSSQVMVMDGDELAAMMEALEEEPSSRSRYLEKALESIYSLEMDHFLILSKSSYQWEPLANTLLGLQKSHRDVLERLLNRLELITRDQIDEYEGLSNLLKEQESLKEDLRDRREQGREQEGFVSPSSAVSFLRLIEQTPLPDLLQATEADPVSKMYFRTYQPQKIRPAAPLSHELSQLLKASGVQAEAIPLQLKSPEGPASGTRAFLASLREKAPDLFNQKILELNFLANVLVSGYAPPGKKRLRPVEALELVLRVCDHGQKVAAKNQIPLKPEDLLKAFQVGWKSPKDMEK